MTPGPVLIDTDADILDCFTVFKALRPHLSEHDFLARVRRQQLQGYRILAFRSGGIVASAAGFRFAEFLAWGKVLYVDDLTTLPDARGQGLAGQLMDWLIAHAREHHCAGLHLDTGYTRQDAHRLYLNKRLRMTCHHMEIDLS